MKKLLFILLFSILFPDTIKHKIGLSYIIILNNSESVMIYNLGDKEIGMSISCFKE